SAVEALSEFACCGQGHLRRCGDFAFRIKSEMSPAAAVFPSGGPTFPVFLAGAGGYGVGEAGERSSGVLSVGKGPSSMGEGASLHISPSSRKNGSGKSSGGTLRPFDNWRCRSVQCFKNSCSSKSSSDIGISPHQRKVVIHGAADV